MALTLGKSIIVLRYLAAGNNPRRSWGNYRGFSEATIWHCYKDLSAAPAFVEKISGKYTINERGRRLLKEIEGLNE
jgi:hypothetical protein